MAYEEYQSFPKESKEPDFRTILNQYLKYWPWFLGSILTAIIIAIAYLTFTNSKYFSATTIILDDEKTKGISGDSNGFMGMSMLSGISTSSIENELGLLRSKRLMTNAVKALNLNIEYYSTDKILKKEYYKNSPYLIRPVSINENAVIKAKKKNENEFIVNYVSDTEVALKFNNKKSLVTNLEDVVSIPIGDFYIISNPEYSGESKSVNIVFSEIETVASKLMTNLNIELVDENSTLIELSIESEVIKKGQDVLDQLVFEYNQEAIEDKNLIARNTAFFIDERLEIINSELDSVETGKEQFKENNRLTDIQAASSLIIQNASDYNKKIQEISTQTELTEAMLFHLSTNGNGLLPSNLGNTGSESDQLVDELNKMVLEKNRLLKVANERNPMVVSLNDQINQIKNNIKSSLEQRAANLKISMNNVRRQAGNMSYQISAVPGQEREYRGIERQQDIKEALYLFLLQKREENSLSLAANAPKAKIVDKAFSIKSPISPNSKIVLTLAVLMGMFIPFLIINIKKLLNDKIRTREELRLFANEIPIIGDIPHIKEERRGYANQSTSRILFEVFNILCANIEYKKHTIGIRNKAKCIFITSSVKGEGKTFVAYNLAMAFAEKEYKVLLIGADLRNPQLHWRDEMLQIQPGLSDYLENSSSNYDDFIEASNLNPKLNILNSGTIPKNPISLLSKNKFGNMLDTLKEQYDYVIVDTAPVIPVADTFSIINHSDLTLYMVRSAYTKKKSIEFVKEINEYKKLGAMAFVLNELDVEPNTYGY